MNVNREDFLKHPLFQKEFVFTLKRKREKEISFEEKISLREGKKIISFNIPLKQKNRIYVDVGKTFKFETLYKKGIDDIFILKAFFYFDIIFNDRNLIELKSRFYIESETIFITEIEGKEDITQNLKIKKKFVEKPGNSYIFSDNWFIYSLFGNQLSLEGLVPSLIFFSEEMEVFPDLSRFKPKIFILKKEIFEKKFLKKVKEEKLYFYLYDADESPGENIFTIKMDIKEIPEIIGGK